MKSRIQNTVWFVLLLALGSVVPGYGQRTSFPRYTPPATPRYTPPPSRPAPQRTNTPAPQRQASSAPQHTQTPPAQHPASAPSTQSRTTPSRKSMDVPSTGSQRAQTPHVDRAQQQRQQREVASQQKERAKQEQSQKKEDAKRQKQEAKAREKQNKEQARLEKQRMKEQQKAQKGAARHQKENPTDVRSAKPQSVAKPEVSAAKASASHAASAYRMPEGSEISSRASSGSMSLTRAGSESTIGQLNSARSSMNGINRRPLPAGDVTVHPNGRLTLNATGGRQYGLRRDGTISSYREGSKSVNFDHNGKVTSLRTASLEERRGPHGQRTIISHGADHSTFVSTGRHSGYAERNVVIANHTYIQRTTVINNRIVSNNFVAFNYGGVAMVRFVTPVFYAPAFYGWAFYPWGVPVHFAFGWFGAPWYVGPNPYFAAYPTYPGAAWWLTDYAIGETLNDAYQLDADAALDDNASYAADASTDGDDSGTDMLAADTTTPISDDVKASIVEQVKQELSYDSAASSAQVQETAYDEVSSVLNRPNQIFIVSSNLDVATADERVCTLQAGDILRLGSESTGDNALVPVRVASSKRMDCPAGTVVTVSTSDLQEMHNNFRTRIESGLGQLQAKQGQNGLPAAPASAVAAPPRPTFTADANAPAPDVTTAFDDQRHQADLAEAQVTQEAFTQGQ